MRKSVMQFFNWWDTPSSSEKKFFESFIGKCADSYDEVHIYATEYSPGNETNGIKMPKNAMSDKILRIQYSGEASYGHLDKFDINIVPGDHPDTPQFIVNPFMHLFIARYGCPMSTFTEKRKYGGLKENFCIFTISNPTANERIRCFNELSKYKKVDSCGKVLNNMGFTCPGSIYSKEYIDIISKYKFNICFENKSMKNYLTEKLALAYMCGTIPIYWGCSNLSDYINMDAIVYLKPDFTDKDLAALIDEVKALDNDETLYKKKFEQPMFKDGLVPAAFDMNELNKKVCKYIESKTQPPLRGGSKSNIIITHVAGFFSTCSVTLDSIIKYFNTNRKLPNNVDTSKAFNWYKTTNINKNIKSTYFKDNVDLNIQYTQPIEYNHDYQFTKYKNIKYNTLTPFINKYFTPSDEILNINSDLKNKYNTNNMEICTLFYRGNDKARETKLPSYDEMKNKAFEVQKMNPSVVFFIQSDEKNFIDEMLKTFKNAFHFKDDIRTISKSNTTVDLAFNKSDTFEFSKKYLAITLFMSETKHIICNSGNCSIWILLFRGNSNNVNQYLNGVWV